MRAEPLLSGGMSLRFCMQLPSLGPPPGGEDAVEAAGIPEDAHLLEPLGPLADPAGKLPLVRLVLEEDPAISGEEPGGLGEDAAVEIEPVGTAIECQVRLVLGN